MTRTASPDTKQKLVETATQLFAEHGFEGVSIAEISAELGVTKQALLHHFGSKEKLYGTVLEALSVRFEQTIALHLESGHAPRERFLLIMKDLYVHMQQNRHDARLIIRELLDNQTRIKDKRKWYLKQFLDTLTTLMLEMFPDNSLARQEAFARTYQIVGAINYFAISDPTLKKMYGHTIYRDMEEIFLTQLEAIFLADLRGAQSPNQEMKR